MQLNVSLSVDELIELLSRLRTTDALAMEQQIMASLADLETVVERIDAVSPAIVTLLNGIAQQLADAKASNDPQKIQEIIDRLAGDADTMAAAVLANTPAEGQPNA